MAEYEVFRSFYSEEEAVAMLNLVREKGIDGRIEKTSILIDKLIVGDGLNPDIHLKIRSSDFPRVHDIIDRHISTNLSALPPDYYLFAFSNKELLEIIKKPDEWNNQDVIIAKKLLADRNVSLSDQEVEKFKKARIKELSQPEQGLPSWLPAGYAIAVIFSIAGIAFGAYMLNAKKVLPDGSKVFVYDKRIRQHCRNIITISVLMTVFTILGLLYNPWIVGFHFGPF